MADHTHGEMNTESQERAFEGFLKVSARVAMISIGALIFMALVNS